METTKKKSLRMRILYRLAKCLPTRLKVSDLETISPSDLLDFGEMAVIPAFQNAAKEMPFYQKILEQKGINATKIQTLEEFSRLVPIIRKTDVFSAFSANDLCRNGKIDDMHSAIVTSGTSGVFAYGILTNEDILFQQKMLDEFFKYYFNAEKESLLIINALAMGVSFASKYPVISTSVRPDIVIHLIKTFHASHKNTVIICDPNFAKKIIDDGMASGIVWKDIGVSFVVGGAWFPNSLAQYILSHINAHTNNPANVLLGTMGLTEIGLNIFSAPTELIAIRNIIQNDPGMLHELFGNEATICPEILYYYPMRTYIEILDANAHGKGDIVISNLDTKTKTPLFRYNTTDQGQLIGRNQLADLLQQNGHDIPLKLQLPLIAVFERDTRDLHPSVASVAEVKEALFQGASIVPSITGHFRIVQDECAIEVQLEKNIDGSDAIQKSIEKNLADISGKQCTIKLIPYQTFSNNVELDYERKWKHIS